MQSEKQIPIELSVRWDGYWFDCRALYEKGEKTVPIDYDEARELINSGKFQQVDRANSHIYSRVSK